MPFSSTITTAQLGPVRWSELPDELPELEELSILIDNISRSEDAPLGTFENVVGSALECFRQFGRDFEDEDSGEPIVFCQCSLGSDWTHLPELDSDGEDSEQHDSDLEETPEIFDKDYLEAISDAIMASRDDGEEYSTQNLNFQMPHLSIYFPSNKSDYTVEHLPSGISRGSSKQEICAYGKITRLSAFTKLDQEEHQKQ